DDEEVESLKSVDLEQLGEEILYNVDFLGYGEAWNYFENNLYKYIAITFNENADTKVIQIFIKNLMLKNINNNKLILLISLLFRDYIIEMKKEIKSLGIDSRYLKYANILKYEIERKSENIEEIS